MYDYDPAKFDSASLIAFVEYWYNNVQARPVPIEKGSLYVFFQLYLMCPVGQVVSTSSFISLIRPGFEFS